MRPLILAAALALAACTTAPAVPMAPMAPMAAAGGSQLAGFATLARFGTWEMELAPAYTRLAALRHVAAHRLDAGRLPVATAIEIQTLADQARAALDASRRGQATEPTPAQRNQLAEALRLIDRVAALLEP